MALLELKAVQHRLKLRKCFGKRRRISHERDFHDAATSEHARVVIDYRQALALCPDGPFEVVCDVVVARRCFPADDRHGRPATFETFFVTGFSALLD